MLHHVGRRVFFEQPTRKYPAPAFAVICAGRTFAHRNAHKCTLVSIGFPWRSPLTCPDKQSHFAKADRFAGLDFKVAGLAVTLIQQADNRNAFGHWRAELLAHGSRYIGRRRSRFFFCRLCRFSSRL
jgi:hypothetical protein